MVRRKVFLVPQTLLICIMAYLYFGLFPYAATAADIGKQDITVMTTDRQVTVRRYAAAGNARRPAVLILHGRSGPAPKPRFAAAYDRYATALANAGIDAYLVSYFSESDGKAMLSDDEAFRAAVRAQRYPAWIGIIRSVANAIARRPEASGRVGLLGFSLGGNLATATAASDPSIAVLVVFYGGIPDTMTGRVSHLPPTLELHGDADDEAPLSDGKALVETAVRSWEARAHFRQGGAPSFSCGFVGQRPAKVPHCVRDDNFTGIDSVRWFEALMKKMLSSRAE